MNKNVLDLEFVRKAIENAAQDQKCRDLHQYSCNHKAMLQALHGTKAMGSIYFIVHFIPLLLNFRRTTKQPVQSFKKFVKGYVKSMMFVYGSMFLVRRGVCFFTEIYKYSNWNAVFTGWICGLMILLEPPGRQIQVSLFTLNKCMEMLYCIARRRHSNLWIQHGQKYLNAIAMAILSYFFIENASIFRTHYQSVLNIFLKDV